MCLVMVFYRTKIIDVLFRRLEVVAMLWALLLYTIEHGNHIHFASTYDHLLPDRLTCEFVTSVV